MGRKRYVYEDGDSMEGKLHVYSPDGPPDGLKTSHGWAYLVKVEDIPPAPEELLPCPFCGGEAQGEENWIECVECGAGTSQQLTPKDARAAWNRRHD